MRNGLNELLFTDFDRHCMKIALEQAELALSEGEVPVGACIAHNGCVIAKARNTRERENNAIRHAEINAIEQACIELGSWRLTECTLYVTLEPCPMCAGAAVNSRLCAVVFGAKDSSYGACGSVLNILNYPLYKPDIRSGLFEAEATALLRNFFASLRKSEEAEL